MANPEHLKLLRTGVDVFNSYRNENPEVRIDLTEADLRGANLCLADLSGANLSKADLSGANLCLADLSGANLSKADLSGAYLIEADLTEAQGLDPAKLVFAALANTQGLPPELQEQVLERLRQSWQPKEKPAAPAEQTPAATE